MADFVLQDTIVGLQALSEFARVAYSDSLGIQVTITADAFTKTLTVNKQNALVLQSVVVSTELWIRCLKYMFCSCNTLTVLFPANLRWCQLRINQI